jgi:hypothetical protein
MSGVRKKKYSLARAQNGLFTLKKFFVRSVISWKLYLGWKKILFPRVFFLR